MNPAFELHLCDCVEGMARLPDASVDVCITSPPYNLGIAYSKYEDGQQRGDYLAWTKKWVGQVSRLLKADGALFLRNSTTRL